MLSYFSRVRLCATLWTAAHQASLSMEFSRQEYWSGLSFPSPGDRPSPGIEPESPALQAVCCIACGLYVDSLLIEPPGKMQSKISWLSSGWDFAFQCRGPRSDPWGRKIPWRMKWQPTIVFLPEKSHGQRSLAGYSPWGHKGWTRLNDSATTTCQQSED